MDRSMPDSLALENPMSSNRVRIAAVADLHVRGINDWQRLPAIEKISQRADVFLVAGDLTENGRLIEAEAAAELLEATRLPVVIVLGNHDLRSLRRVAFRHAFERRGIEVLEGRAIVIELNGARVGIAGATGCGGGFWPVEGPCALHDRTMKRLALRAKRESAALDRALLSLEADVGIAITHFSPTTSTLGREPLAKYWMLGNSELGIVLDDRRPDLVIHGHAHLGARQGLTPGGLPVRNVALPVVNGIHVETFHVVPRGYAAVALAGSSLR
jgi:Icc-related predicted phosphoesterase